MFFLPIDILTKGKNCFLNDRVVDGLTLAILTNHFEYLVQDPVVLAMFDLQDDMVSPDLICELRRQEQGKSGKAKHRKMRSISDRADIPAFL
jgi:hypothetical protein